MEKLLIIDDEPGIRLALRNIAEAEGLCVLEADHSERGYEYFTNEAPAIVLLDVRIGNDCGIELFHRIRQFDPRALIVLITGHGSNQLAIESMKMGAFEYLQKPLDLFQIQTIVRRGIEIHKAMCTPAQLSDTVHDAETSDRLVGKCVAIQELCKNIGRFAPQNVNVLILGESGTGKELVARAIYQHSRRSNSKFLAVNCSAIPEPLLESELFGHEKGSFTGADRRRIGMFEQCHSGTIFLDEIGDMPLTTQAKILRVVQNGEFQRVGGNETLKTDVRLISATHQSLDRMIAQGTFRQDLYFRLKGVSVHLPPLRERLSDIAELAHYFLFRLNHSLGKQVATISAEAIEMLQNHSWPGNVRELQGVIREAIIRSTGPCLLPEFLPQLNSNARASESISFSDCELMVPTSDGELFEFCQRILDQHAGAAYREAVSQIDRILIRHSLILSGGNQQKAASILGVSRPTLRSKIRLIQEAHAISQEPTALPRS